MTAQALEPNPDAVRLGSSFLDACSVLQPEVAGSALQFADFVELRNVAGAGGAQFVLVLTTTHVHLFQAGDAQVLFRCSTSPRLSDLCGASIPLKVQTLASGDEIAHRTSDIVLHFLPDVGGMRVHFDVWLRCASNHRRACTCDALDFCFRDAHGSTLLVDHMPPEEMVGWRRAVCFPEAAPPTVSPATAAAAPRRAPSLLRRMVQSLPKLKGRAALADADGTCEATLPAGEAAAVGTGSLHTGVAGEVITYTLRSGQKGMVAEAQLVSFGVL